MVFGINVPYFSGREEEYFGINVAPGGRRCEDLAPIVDEATSRWFSHFPVREARRPHVGEDHGEVGDDAIEEALLL